MQKLTKERGREENPRQDGKRQEGKEAGGLKDGIGSLKKVGEHLAHRQRKRESPHCKALMQMHAWQQEGNMSGAEQFTGKPRR